MTETSETVETPEQGTILVPNELLQMIQLAPEGQQILTVCIDLAAFLAQKNYAYGNGVFEPVNVFSKLNPEEQLRVRMDDKIKRIQMGREFGNEDSLRDLLGYLVLYFVLKSRSKDDGDSIDGTPEQT